MAKKDYNTKNIATIWMNTNKNTGEDFVSVQLVSPEDDKGKANDFYKGTLFFQDEESGNLYKINKLKVFENKKHSKILGNICVELNDEDYSQLVTDED